MGEVWDVIIYLMGTFFKGLAKVGRWTIDNIWQTLRFLTVVWMLIFVSWVIVMTTKSNCRVEYCYIEAQYVWDGIKAKHLPTGKFVLKQSRPWCGDTEAAAFDTPAESRDFAKSINCELK